MPIVGNTSSEGKKPDTPTIGTASADNASASVAFTISSYPGKGTITYTATSNPGSVTATGSSSPISVSGLSNGTSYTFNIRGVTDYGVSSEVSGDSNSVTPVAPYYNPYYNPVYYNPYYNPPVYYNPVYYNPYYNPPVYYNPAPTYRKCSTSQVVGGYCCPSGFGGSFDCWDGGAGASCSSPTC
jgi:hypothetical protein